MGTTKTILDDAVKNSLAICSENDKLKKTITRLDCSIDDMKESIENLSVITHNNIETITSMLNTQSGILDNIHECISQIGDMIDIVEVNQKEIKECKESISSLEDEKTQLQAKAKDLTISSWILAAGVVLTIFLVIFM